MIEQSWRNVTTWALRDWRAAQERYGEELYGPGRLGFYRDREENRWEVAYARLMVARADYRRRVLSWYWKLCTPMQLGECVPTEVAELLAEDWDLRAGSAAGDSGTGNRSPAGAG